MYIYIIYKLEALRKDVRTSKFSITLIMYIYRTAIVSVWLLNALSVKRNTEIIYLYIGIMWIYMYILRCLTLYFSQCAWAPFGIHCQCPMRRVKFHWSADEHARTIWMLSCHTWLWCFKCRYINCRYICVCVCVYILAIRRRLNRVYLNEVICSLNWK